MQQSTVSQFTYHVFNHCLISTYPWYSGDILVRDMSYERQELRQRSSHVDQIPGYFNQLGCMRQYDKILSTCHIWVVRGWCMGDAWWSYGGFNGCEKQNQVNSSLFWVMFMVFICFVWWPRICYVELSQCTPVIQKISRCHATFKVCLSGMTLAEFSLVWSWRNSLDCKWRVLQLWGLTFQFGTWRAMADWWWI
jgi:hypothetical protein